MTRSYDDLASLWRGNNGGRFGGNDYPLFTAIVLKCNTVCD